jgi:NADH:ubiquinone oxidoreductase subunit H
MKNSIFTLTRSKRQVLTLIITSTLFFTGILLLFAEPIEEDFSIILFIILKVLAFIILFIGYACFKALNDSN